MGRGAEEPSEETDPRRETWASFAEFLGPARFQRVTRGCTRPDGERVDAVLGITKEAWFVAPVAGGEQFVGYIETGDLGKAFQMFVESRVPFDIWFKERLANATGVDLNDPPKIDLPEPVSSYATE